MLTDAQAQLMRKWYQLMVANGRPTVEGGAAYLFFQFFPLGTNERSGPQPGAPSRTAAKRAVSGSGAPSDAAAARNLGGADASKGSEQGRLESALRRGTNGELMLGGTGAPVGKVVDTWRDRTGICSPNFGRFSRDNNGVWLAVLPSLQALLAETVSSMFQAHDERAVRLLANTMRLKPAGSWSRLTAAVDGAGFVSSFVVQMAPAIDLDKRFRVAVGLLLRAAVDAESTIDELFTKVAGSSDSLARGRHNAEYCAKWGGTPFPWDYRRWRESQNTLSHAPDSDPFISYEYFAALERVRPGIKDADAAKRRVGYRGKDRHAGDMEGEGDACIKAFSIRCGLTQGVFNVACPHVITLGFCCLFRAESVGKALSIVLERFPRLPKVIFYDVAYKLDKNAHRRVRPILRAHGVRCILDRPLSITHSCSPEYMPDESLGATAGVATQAAEVSHAIAAANRACLAFMSPPTYMVHKMVQVAMMNVRKIHRMSQANGGGEIDHIPLSPFCHSRVSRVCQRGSACSCQASVADTCCRQSEGALLVKMAAADPEVDRVDEAAPDARSSPEAVGVTSDGPVDDGVNPLRAGLNAVGGTDGDPRHDGGYQEDPMQRHEDNDDSGAHSSATGEPGPMSARGEKGAPEGSGGITTGDPVQVVGGAGGNPSPRLLRSFVPLSVFTLGEAELNLVNSFTVAEQLALPVGGENKAKTVLMGVDFLTLRGEQWLNDEVMNSFVALINHRDELARRLTATWDSETRQGSSTFSTSARRHTFMFNTFFFSRLLERGEHYDYEGVQNWGRKCGLDLRTVDMIVVPMHVDADHWVLAAIDVQKKSMLLYDPLFSSDHDRHVPYLLRWLHEEVCERLGAEVAAEWDAPSWPIVQGNDLPLQKDGSSCGVFVLAVADCIALRVAASFTQDDVPVLR